MPAAEKISRRTWILLICLVLTLSTTAVYWHVRYFSFVNYDDPLYVLENPHVQQGLTPGTLIWAFTDATEYTNYWAPLTWLSFLVDYEFHGMHAGGYHVTNLLLHITNALLLFLVLQRMTGAVWRSAFVAALFALHPLHVESVAWVTERKDVLSTLFWMLTLGSYHYYTERPGPKRYLLVFFLFLLGLMSKPMLVTLPFVFLLLDIWPLCRFEHDCFPQPDSRSGRLVLEKIPFLLAAVLLSVAAYVTQDQGGAIKDLGTYSVGVRISNVLVAYVTYIGKMLWPTNLTVLYPHPGALPFWKTAGAGALLGIITAVVLIRSRRQPYLPIGWFWYLGTLVPVVGIVVIGPHAIADRYAYIPLIGLYVIIAWGATDLTDSWRYRYGARIVAAACILTALMVATQAQVRHWSDSVTLFSHTLEVAPIGNYRANYNLGVALQESGMIAGAAKQFETALKIKPDFDKAHNNLGILHYKYGEQERARKHFEAALDSNPGHAKAHYNLGCVSYELGDVEKALRHLEKALELAPDYAKAREVLESLRRENSSAPIPSVESGGNQ